MQQVEYVSQEIPATDNEKPLSSNDLGASTLLNATSASRFEERTDEVEVAIRIWVSLASNQEIFAMLSVSFAVGGSS